MSARKNDSSLDMLSITDLSVDPLLEFGRELISLVDAIIGRDEPGRNKAMSDLVAAAGPEFAVRAAAVTGNFEMMNRLLDGIGVGPTDMATKIAPRIGLDWPLSP